MLDQQVGDGVHLVKNFAKTKNADNYGYALAA
jgi:hypothetical protein